MEGNISPKQQEILDFIKKEIRERGFPPAVREICQAVNLKSTSSVHAHLDTLEKNGYIRRDSTKPRAIEILDTAFQTMRREIKNVPVFSADAQGAPFLSGQNIIGYFPVPAEYIPDEPVFMMKIKGDGMIRAGILDGDTVLVHQQDTAGNGDMIIALAGDTAAAGTYYKEKKRCRLQPENDTMEPFFAEQLQILGKICGVFRFY